MNMMNKYTHAYMSGINGNHVTNYVIEMTHVRYHVNKLTV